MKGLVHGFIAFCMLWSAPLMAGTMTAGLNRTEVFLGERVFVEVVVSGSIKGDVQAPTTQGLVLERTGTASNFTWNNGKTTAEVRYTYSVFIDQPGDFTIGSFVADVDGQQMQTLPLKLKVKPAVNGGNNNPGLGQTRPPPPGSRGGQPNANPNVGDDIFIEREIANKNPYVGEPVISTIRIYHRALSGGNPKVTASADVRRLPIKGENEYKRRYQGRLYNVIEKKEIIVPLKAGKVAIPPYVLQARMLQPMGNPGSIFDMLRGGNFNFTQELEVDVASAPMDIEVKPLPEAGKPANFSGLVGQFNATLEFEKQELEVGDSTSLNITITGQGLLDTLGNLPLTQLDAIGKIYPNAPKFSENADSSQGVASSAIYSYAIVPEQVGSFPLGDFALAFFDPEVSQYRTLRRPLGTLTVKPSTRQEKAPVLVGGVDQNLEQQRVSVLGEDLVGLHRDENLLSSHGFGPRAYVELALFGGVPLILLFGLLGFQMRRDRGSRLTAKERGSQALAHFKKQLQSCVAVADRDPLGALSEVKKGFASFVCASLKIPPGVLTPKEIRSHLISSGVDPEVVKRVEGLLDELNRLEFSGVAVSRDRVTVAAEKLGELAVAISKNY